MSEKVDFKTAEGVDVKDPMCSFPSIEYILKKYVPEKERKAVLTSMYGKGSKNLDDTIPKKAKALGEKENFEIKIETMVQNATKQSTKERRVVRIGAIQNSIAIKDTSKPVLEQLKAMHAKMEKMIDAAGECGVNVLGLQEAWTAPFFMCTREKYPWCEFAEDAKTGLTAKFISRMAKKWGMVIVSPILERDSEHGETFWNTAVVFGDNGNYLGKSRKNHIPRVGDFNEANYYLEGNTGHPVFETKFGKIAINICFGRHHPLNWMHYGLNGAEIVFNPSATVGALSEPMWGIEARCAAIANSYFSVAINRIGTESFPHAFTSGDKKPEHKNFGHFYGSSYVSAPDSARTPGLSRVRDGLLCVDVDLNQIIQTRDRWMFYNTARFEMYAKKFAEFVKKDFKRDITKDPSLK